MTESDTSEIPSKSPVLKQIQHDLSGLKLDDSYLFLNHALAISRGDNRNPTLASLIRKRKTGAPAFLIQFLAK